MLARLNQQSQKLKDDVQIIVEQNRKSTPSPTPTTMPAFKQAKRGEKEKEKKAESKASLPHTSDLRELQSKLQASINMKGKET